MNYMYMGLRAVVSHHGLLSVMRFLKTVLINHSFSASFFDVDKRESNILSLRAQLKIGLAPLECIGKGLSHVEMVHNTCRCVNLLL